MFIITKLNMKDICIQNWGWDEDDVNNGLFSPLDQHILIYPVGQEHNLEQLCGLMTFSFEMDDENRPLCSALYIKSLQMCPEFQGIGLGRKLMEVAELISRRTRMCKLMLTVFKNNERALRLYSKMSMSIDERSPSLWGYDVCYEVLSKRTR